MKTCNHVDQLDPNDDFISYEEPNFHAKNKAATISSILHTAKTIIDKDGLQALKINRLARESGRSKSIIYDYFGDIEGVLSIVLTRTDPWMKHKNNLNDILDSHRDTLGRHLAAPLLHSHFLSYLNDPIARAVSISELTEKDNPALLFLSESREKLGESIFELSAPLFDNSDVNIRMVFALLISGIKHLVLHKENTRSTFCGIDIVQDQEILLRTINHLISWSYEHAEKQATNSVQQ